MSFANLHQAFDGRSPKGVGVAMSLVHINQLAKLGVAKLMANPVDRVNQNIPLTPIERVCAAIHTTPAQIEIDPLTAAFGFSLTIWLHKSGDPNKRIIQFDYSLRGAHVEPVVDHGAGKVYLQADQNAVLHIDSQQNAPDADQNLIECGYFTTTNSTPAADWDRFNREVVYPFTWLNSRGLVAAIFRAIPVPQIFSFFKSIRPVPPIQAIISDQYLHCWTETAQINLPLCDAPPPSIPDPNLTWRPNGVAPASPWDKTTPSLAI